ncbi:uncharacterized protein OCT59_026593 [Rhizophagus irregularis]|uniref:Ypk2p n=2 Tax=Rhizophagus irregularis TaxID=588596 RepID=A0A015IHC7_RHIIW|nr:Ypk2p [Rhizophagus irregularis DAOM 197198w]UZO06264.1 hypothetical protein OCT59_026593 [Rhizophagus irregularis]GBC16647.1 kinase-like domain-containing protein [Rhizophagus irregularis DAOM 181602=DAOM 197198]
MLFDLKWKRKFNVLQNTESGLKRILIKGLIHRELHIGNIVCFNSVICIAGMSSCKPVNYEELEDNVYGILPYVAPGILRGQIYTQSSDIYSFGIIMFRIISGFPPYYDNAAQYLALNICEDKPNAMDLSKIFYKWMNELSAYINSKENQTELAKN